MSFLVLLYADVTVILSDNKGELQKSLDGHYKYCKEWELEVNPTTTKDIVFSGRKPKPNDNVFTYNGNVVEVVANIKYLGIWYIYNNNYNTCITHLHDRTTQKAMYAFRRTRTWYTNQDLFI